MAAASVRAVRSAFITTARRSGKAALSAVPMVFSADETTDIGRDTATPVSSDHTRTTSVFNGKVSWVQIDLGKDVHDHLISPEERLNLAMARQ
jgi:uncharacterized protein YifN (PemK superfamily)